MRACAAMSKISSWSSAQSDTSILQNYTPCQQEGKYYSEEARVDLQNPRRDYELYKNPGQELQQLMAEIQDLKSRGGKDVTIEMEEWTIHFMTLKKFNRLSYIRLKKGRKQIHEAKQKVNAYHLQLQKLLFEEALPDTSKAEITMGDPYQPTLARLAWELEQQKRLTENYLECLSNKKSLKETEVKEYLSSLQPRLNSIMLAFLLVQEYLFMPCDQVHKQYETARHLPPPLYVMFVQATVYGQACNKTLSVAIEGSVDEASALFKPPEDSQDDESDSDAEEEQTTKCRQPTLGIQLDDKHMILKRHPLSVMLY
ncbi:THO complex subunit 5 like protein [Tupaia chinensis]|uniref:THO complex subunit 5 like protein n=1 Tax=Tupaia chinensis TaxID=246437 RepID=L9JWE7_TUPCH|nr:THO complex subunit 5 like protein [Tupaia chinensis]